MAADGGHQALHAVNPVEAASARRFSGYAVALSAALLVVSAPAFLLLFRNFPVWQANGSTEVLLVALICLGTIASLTAVAVKGSHSFDIAFAMSILLLVYFGPVPALALMVGTELITWLLERYRVIAVVANIASFVTATVVAALVLQEYGQSFLSIDAQSYLALFVSGAVYWLVNVSVTRALVGVINDGLTCRTIAREVMCMAPAPLMVVLLSVATAFLYTQIGILALGIFAAITLVPQLLLPILLRPRPVEELSHADAVALYSKAIASVMKLDSTTKEILNDAAHHIEGPESQANGGKIKASYSGEHFHDVVEAVLYYREHWDSAGGFPGGVGGEMIPLTSRVLAVADNWAQLTATGVWTVTHAQAIAKLQEHAGVEYDPRIVAAAAKVVEEERMGLTDNQPQLHEVPLPQLVRKVPRLGGLLAPNRS